MVDPRIQEILDALLASAAGIVDFGRFYVTLYNRITVQLDYPLAAEKSGGKLQKLESGQGRWASRLFQPQEWLPDSIFVTNEPVLIEAGFEDWLATNGLQYGDSKLPASWLGVPMAARGRVIGVIAAEDLEQERAFDEQTQDFLSALAQRAASAIAKARLAENLRVANEVGHTLTSSVRLSTDEILKLIHKEASRLMDTRNMYVALYNAACQELDFPLAKFNGQDEIWPSRHVDPKDLSQGGLTEEVLRTRDPLCPPNVQKWYKERGLTPAVEPVPKSWLGVPLMVEDRVLGVIALQNDAVERLFGRDDQEVLQTMANQAAVALANTNLVERLRIANQVGQRLTSDIRLSRDRILKEIYEQASLLMDTRNMYVALYDAGRREISFPLAKYNGTDAKWKTRIVDLEDKTQGWLTETVIRTKKPLCPENVEVWYDERGLEPVVPPIPKSWLGVPMMAGERVLGVVALQNDEAANLFGPDDRELLQTMANQAAVALANAELVGRLQAVNKVGQSLTADIRRSEKEILNLVYEQAGPLMDTRDMYVALYDEGQQELSFPLAYQDGKPGKPEDWPSRPFKEGPPTEEVIRTRQLLRISNYGAWYQERGIEPPVKPEEMPKSWMGVPMKSKAEVLGIIALQNDEVGNLYTQDDEEVLQTMGNQAAIALENTRIVKELEQAQKQIAETEAVVTRTSIATDIVHRLNNRAGTIPIWVELIRGHLDPKILEDETLNRYLNSIESDTGEILRAAEELNLPLKEQNIDLGSTLRTLVRQALVQTPAEIEVQLSCSEKLPVIRAVDIELKTAIWSVLENGIDAMPNGGTLRIQAEPVTDTSGEEWVHIQISDEGAGIAHDESDRVFLPFYTTKRGHLGYGLWRARNICERIGGSISFESRKDVGTNFLLKLPASKEAI